MECLGQPTGGFPGDWSSSSCDRLLGLSYGIEGMQSYAIKSQVPDQAARPPWRLRSLGWMTRVIGENVCLVTGLIIPSTVRVEQSEGLIYPVVGKLLWSYSRQGHPLEVDTPTLWTFGSVP